MVKISYPKEIQTFLDKVVLKIKQSLDPEFILIAGSFGKNSWLYYEKELISDFELVFVCKKKWSLKKKKNLLQMLNKQYSYDISLKGFLLNKIQKKIISNYSLKYPGYLSLDFFDTFSNPQVLYSKHDRLLKLDIKVDEVPAWEAWRLYVNRMGDILSLSVNNELPKHLEKYYWLKIFESTADAFLIIENLYKKNISERYATFTKGLLVKENDLSSLCKESFPIIQMALNARQQHDLSIFDIDISTSKKKQIILFWMSYFEKVLLIEEKIIIIPDNYFQELYLDSNKLQNKYLGTYNKFNILISNFIKLIFYPNLLDSSFRFYNMKNSWRHIILLTISTIFCEQVNNSERYSLSKKILDKIIVGKKINSLPNDKFIFTALKYWKILR